MSGFSFLTVKRDNSTFNNPLIYFFRLVPLAKFDFLTSGADVANRRLQDATLTDICLGQSEVYDW